MRPVLARPALALALALVLVLVLSAWTRPALPARASSVQISFSRPLSSSFQQTSQQTLPLELCAAPSPEQPEPMLHRLQS